MANRQRLFALLLRVLGAASAAMGCADSSVDDASSESQLTLTDGAQFVVSAEATRVVLRKSTENGNLLAALRRDSRDTIHSLQDLVGKAVLIHPLADKATDGAFMRVDAVTEQGNELRLDGASIRLEELDDLNETDVVRVYMDQKLPRGGDGTRPAAFAPVLSPGRVDPTNFNFDASPRPTGFGGLLAGEAPTVIVWGGVAPRVDFLGFVKPYVSDFSFRPEVRLDWQRGRGLDVGLRLDFETESGVDLEGILGAHGTLFNQVVETPDVTLLAPGGLALPFKLTFSASFSCRAVGGGKINFGYRNRMKIHAGGSAVIRPEWTEPAENWVTPGAWPFELDGSSTSNVVKLAVDPSVGLLCIAALKANFSPKWLPTGSLYVSISPQMLLLAAEDPKPRFSVNLGAGAKTAGDLSAELNLLRWTP